MKKMRKLAALLLAVMMTVGLCATAWASSVNQIDADGTNETSANTISFKNVLVAYNPDETSIYAPALSYAFAIEAATTEGQGVGTTVTDSNDVQAIVLPGNYSGTDSNGNTIAVSGTPRITVAKPAYTMDETITAAPNGADNESLVTVDFNNVTFPKPGIYRYVLTRTVTDANAALETQDTTQTTNKNIRYLDVYVQETLDGTEVKHPIYGYVLHNVTDDIDEDTEKSDGFYDDYKTSNLVVSKTLVNDAAMNGHKFPFTVTFANTKNGHIMVDAKEGTDGKAEVAAMGAGATTSAPKIAHQGAVKYIGIPNGFTSTVYETNDVTGTTYNSVGVVTSTKASGTDTNAAAKSIVWEGAGAQSNSALTAAAVDVTKTDAFTNTLEVISPTGVVLRVAPYVLMLAAGLMLLMLSRRRRTALDD